MITKENLIETANKLYEYITINFVEGDEPYWSIESPDPEEIDEDIVVAKLYYDTFNLEIKTLTLNRVINFCEIFGEDEDSLRENDPEWFLKYVIDEIHNEVKECISYDETLLDYLK